MTQSPLTLRRWKRVEYERLVDLRLFEGDPVELIGGQVVVAEPQSSYHATVVGAADDALRSILPPGWIVRAQMPVALDDESAPEPDLVVVPGIRADYRETHPACPVLPVEGADSSLAFDREHKGSLYARARRPRPRRRRRRHGGGLDGRAGARRAGSHRRPRVQRGDPAAHARHRDVARRLAPRARRQPPLGILSGARRRARDEGAEAGQHHRDRRAVEPDRAAELAAGPREAHLADAAGLAVARRLHPVGDTGRRAGRDAVAGTERHEAAHVGDELADREDHVGGAAALA